MRSPHAPNQANLCEGTIPASRPHPFPTRPPGSKQAGGLSCKEPQTVRHTHTHTTLATASVPSDQVHAANTHTQPLRVLIRISPQLGRSSGGACMQTVLANRRPSWGGLGRTCENTASRLEQTSCAATGTSHVGMGQYPVLSRGPTPLLLQTLVAPALFQIFVARHHYMMDLVAPALSQKPSLLQTLSREGRPGTVTKQKVLTRCHVSQVIPTYQSPTPSNAVKPLAAGKHTFAVGCAAKSDQPTQAGKKSTSRGRIGRRWAQPASLQEIVCCTAENPCIANLAAARVTTLPHEACVASLHKQVTTGSNITPGSYRVRTLNTTGRTNP